MTTRLRSGAESRLTNAVDRLAVVCVNGGQGEDVAGTWSATLRWLIERLAPRFPELGFVEVKYRIKSWKRLGMCTEDALAALELARDAGARRCALVGFSMGGAVAIGAAKHPAVATVIGLAPWIPDRLDVSPLAGRRFVVIHGALDRYLPGIPGVSPVNSRRGFERAQASGVDGTYTLIQGAVHGVALNGPFGAVVGLPRARRWAALLGAELERFQASD